MNIILGIILLIAFSGGLIITGGSVIARSNSRENRSTYAATGTMILLLGSFLMFLALSQINIKLG